MTKYDVRIKSFLRHGATVLLADMGITENIDPVDTDLSYIRAPRADYLGKDARGHLVHIEVQSHTDSSMPLRMLEYYTHILRARANWRKIDYQQVVDQLRVRQFAVYMDEAPRQNPGLKLHPRLDFRYDQYCLASAPRSAMLASDDVGDVVLSLLCHGTGTVRERAREIILRVRAMAESGAIDASVREYAMGCLLVLGGMKEATLIVDEEIRELEMDIDLSGSEIFKEYSERDQCNELILAIDERLSLSGFAALNEKEEEVLRELDRRELMAVAMDLHLGLDQAIDAVHTARKRNAIHHR